MVIHRLAGLGLSRPIETRYLWDILFRLYLLKIGRPTPEYCRPTGGSRQNRWSTPGVHRRWCQRGKTACARRPHEEEGISLNRFGGVGGAAGRIPFAAGELGALCTLAPWPKYMAAGTRVSGCWFWPRGQTCRAGVSADKPAAPFCLMPGSHILL